MSNEVWNLLSEFNKFENIIRNSMMPNEQEIIQGINLVREIVKELNPNVIDSAFGIRVRFIIDKYNKNLHSQMRVVNNYTAYGISNCLSIIDGLIKLKEKSVKVLIKE